MSVGWSPGPAGRRDTGCGDHRRGKCRAGGRSGWDDHGHDLVVEAVTTSRVETRSSTELCTTRDGRRVSDRFVPRYVSRICRTDTRCHVFPTTGCRARAPPAWVDNPSRQIGCGLTRRASRATVTPSSTRVTTATFSDDHRRCAILDVPRLLSREHGIADDGYRAVSLRRRHAHDPRLSGLPITPGWPSA